MPQMAPYNWLILFFMFNLILLFLVSFNNYINMPKIKNINLNYETNTNLFTWKW